MHRSFIGIVIIAMQWIKEHGIDKAVIVSDSWAALTSNEILQARNDL